METYQRILVATDFSEQSLIALCKAQDLAKNLGAQVELLHVIDVPVYPVLEDVAIMGVPSVWDVELAQTLLEASEKKLKEIAHTHNISQFMTIAGNPSSEIVTLANVNKIDVIVMGFHGLSGFKKLIGSTTHSVINNAPCDVLAVKQA